MRKAIFALSCMLLLACSNKPSEQELSALSKQAQAAEAAAHRVQALDNERSALQGELQAEKATQARLQGELNALEQGSPK